MLLVLKATTISISVMLFKKEQKSPESSLKKKKEYCIPSHVLSFCFLCCYELLLMSNPFCIFT